MWIPSLASNAVLSCTLPTCSSIFSIQFNISDNYSDLYGRGVLVPVVVMVIFFLKLGLHRNWETPSLTSNKRGQNCADLIKSLFFHFCSSSVCQKSHDVYSMRMVLVKGDSFREIVVKRRIIESMMSAIYSEKCRYRSASLLIVSYHFRTQTITQIVCPFVWHCVTQCQTKGTKRGELGGGDHPICNDFAERGSIAHANQLAPN